MAELRAFGLTYPGAHTKSPWPGHLDLAVNDKTFAYLSAPGDPFKLSCKLPHSREEALALPFASPTPYGLGKSGWVTAELPEGAVPVEMFQAWIDESYRAQAPKRLVASLAQGKAELAAVAAPAEKPRPARKQRAAKKRAALKPAPRSRAAQRKPARKAPARAPRRLDSAATLGVERPHPCTSLPIEAPRFSAGRWSCWRWERRSSSSGSSGTSCSRC